MKHTSMSNQVSLQREVNVEADTQQEAEAMALKMARDGEVSLRFPDCGSLAVAFELEKDSMA